MSGQPIIIKRRRRTPAITVALEGGLCRFCDRHDGAVYRALAGQFQQAGAGRSRRLLPRSQGTAAKIGSNLSGAGENFTLDKQDMSKLKEQLQSAIRRVAEFDKLKNQIEMTVTAEGLRIELMEADKGTFFESGSSHPTGKGEELCAHAGAGVGQAAEQDFHRGPHRLEALFAERAAYGNWELSADRANAARRLMQELGLAADQVSQVWGFADQHQRLRSESRRSGESEDLADRAIR